MIRSLFKPLRLAAALLAGTAGMAAAGQVLIKYVPEPTGPCRMGEWSIGSSGN